MPAPDACTAPRSRAVGQRPLLRGALTALITAALTWFVFFTGTRRTGYWGYRVLHWSGDWVDWGALLIITIIAIAIAAITWSRLDYHDPSL